MSELNLTPKEAYLAMFGFLATLYDLTKEDYLGGLLGGMSFLEDGSTADPAAWHDWLQAVEKVRRGDVNADLHLKD